MAKIRRIMRAAMLCAGMWGSSLAAPGVAQEPPDWNAETLSGDWNGERTRLSRRGVNWDIAYTADVMANVAGSASRGSAYMDNLDVKLQLDLERFAGWRGTRAFLHVLANQGGKLNRNYTRSFMNVDNIEVDTNTAKLCFRPGWNSRLPEPDWRCSPVFMR